MINRKKTCLDTKMKQQNIKGNDETPKATREKNTHPLKKEHQDDSRIFKDNNGSQKTIQ